MKKIFMMVHELDVNKGGMTSSMFNRSKEFYDADIPADIVTFDYKGNYDEIIKALKKQGKMDRRTKMYNVFEYFKQISNNKHFKSNKLLYKHISERLKNTIEIEESKGISRYFDITTGTYIAYIRKSKSEKVIDFFKDNKRIERFSFIDNKVHMKGTFNVDNKVCYQVFYDEKGYPYISRNINANNGAVGKTYVLVNKKEFKNNLALCVYYLEKLIKDSKDSIMICDGPGSFPKMFNTNHKNAQKYGVIHVNHHENFDDTGAFKKSEKYIIENANKINGVIVLTEAQRLDILNQFDVENIFTISNFVKIHNAPKHFQTEKIVGHISRMVPTKRIDLLIEVAELVVKKDNAVKFHIYGEGSVKDKIAKMIEDKNLERNVFLKGYTTTPQKCLEDFKLVVSTSQYEGQGLSMIEAMISKRPVVAFDIKYGPSDFIEDNKNGYLIENHNINDMADKILKLVNNDVLAEEFGSKARENIIEKYSTESILEKWLNLFNS